MRVSDAMSTNIVIVTPDQTLQTAAHLMQKVDSGFLPVGEDDRLVGTITDRDMAIRALARGKGPDTTVRDVMSRDVKYCFDDQDIDEVSRNLGDQQVRRLPVVDRDKRLVGVISLGDIAGADGSQWQAGAALKDVTRRGGAHRQV